ncbi:probable chitinase 10 [Lingula anatina]|uniref:Probable chitinase 10 n=1 Tax=Lingula anatina TaxID=7574 RepID=A0A1S3JAH7_LINAN|nr:probable chitinase 10 [Lingula anatina]|eukprot:XP_013407410.1 probable chitinase 10 [Lingula anatina]
MHEPLCRVLPDNSNCGGYRVICPEGVVVNFDCPGDLKFRAGKKICDLPQNVDCGRRLDHGKLCQKPSGNFPEPGDCSTFLSCDGYMIQRGRLCPPGLLFNPKAGACDWPDKVDCPYR